MPLYDFICPECGERFEAVCAPTERLKMYCNCGALAEPVITAGKMSLFSRKKGKVDK